MTSIPTVRASSSATSPKLLDWSKVRRVLLIRLRSIGDTVLMTPCLSALKSEHPNIHTTVLLEATALPILQGHAQVDQLIVSPDSFSQKVSLLRNLRAQRFDVAFNMHGGSTGTFLAALSGARHTVGYAGYRYSRLLTARAPAPDVILNKPQIHSVEQQLALLNWAGLPWPSSAALSLPVLPEARDSVKARLRSIGLLRPGADSASYAVISPAASSPSKRWPAVSFGLASAHLYDFWRVKSVVIAGEGEEHIAREVAEAAGDCASVLTGLTLNELTALIRDAKAFVGNDSGPMHIAAAMKTPLIAIFGSSNLDVWRPWSEAPNRALSPALGASEAVPRPRETMPLGATQETPGPADATEGGQSFPIQTISVSAVMGAIDEVMEEAL